jgi:NitT/TauT family transport system permease protein
MGKPDAPDLGAGVIAARRWMPLVDSAIFVLLILVGWQLLFVRVGNDGFASPGETIGRLATLAFNAGFWNNVEATAVAFAWACVFAIGGGLGVGLLLGASRFAGEVADPILNALASLPKITLYPVILLFFGLGLQAKVAFGTIHGIFPVIIMTMNGVRTIKPVVRKTARVLRLSLWETMRTVLLPAALPEIFSGVRVGIALALLGTLIGELFASDRGIGFLLMSYVNRQDGAGVIALTVVLFAVAVTIGSALLALDARLHHR